MADINGEVELTLIQTEKAPQGGMEDSLVEVDVDQNQTLDFEASIQVGVEVETGAKGKAGAKGKLPKEKKVKPPPKEKKVVPRGPGIFDKARNPEVQDPNKPRQLTQKLDYKYILEKCLEYDEELGGEMRGPKIKGPSDNFFQGTHEIRKLTKIIKSDQDKRNKIRKKYGKNLQSIDLTTKIHELLDKVEDKVEDISLILHKQIRDKLFGKKELLQKEQAYDTWRQIMLKLREREDESLNFELFTDGEESFGEDDEGFDS
jgi:hypothetical protein